MAAQVLTMSFQTKAHVLTERNKRLQGAHDTMHATIPF